MSHTGRNWSTLFNLFDKKALTSPYGLFFLLKQICTYLWRSLRIPAMYEVKNSKICNFWTFWPVIQLINHLFQIRQKAFLKKLPLQVRRSRGTNKPGRTSLYSIISRCPFMGTLIWKVSELLYFWRTMQQQLSSMALLKINHLVTLLRTRI